MRAPLVLALCSLLAAPAFADPAADAKAHSEAFARAAQARDVAAAVALYADDARMIWPGQGEEATGKAAITKLITSAFDPAAGPAPIFKSQEVIPLGDGYTAVLGHWEQPVKGPKGQTRMLQVRTSEVLRTVGGKSLYVVDHASVGLPPAPAAAAAPRKGKKIMAP
jgi:ketosteroid isomerase-like protein